MIANKIIFSELEFSYLNLNDTFSQNLDVDLNKHQLMLDLSVGDSDWLDKVSIGSISMLLIRYREA